MLVHPPGVPVRVSTCDPDFLYGHIWTDPTLMPDQHRIVGLTLVGGPVGGWFLVVNRTPCGDDTTDVADPDPDPPTSEPDSTEDEPDSVDESDLTAEPDDAPVELTASFRGATEDVIRVGVVAIDFDRLADAGVQINSGDAGAIYTAALEAINDRGGIYGRQLELTTETYLPIGGIEADEICVRLAEDVEVFMVSAPSGSIRSSATRS